MGDTCDKNLTHTKSSQFMGDTCDQSFGLSYACANLSLNPHAQLASGARNTKSYLSLHLLQYFMYASNKCSYDSSWMHRLARAFTDRPYDRYQNLVSWLNNISFVPGESGNPL